jgi:hypothetical protein
MRSRELGLYSVFLLLIFFLIGFVSAQTTCSDPSQIILRLSDTTNAHAEVFDGAGNYHTEICYDNIFVGEIGGGNRTCSGTNGVLDLSDTTNAHAENTSESNYNTNVCYTGLTCNARTSDCGVDDTDEVLVVSLSANTNAHLASDNSYPVKICCKPYVTPPEPCEILNAFWRTPDGDLDVVEGTGVQLVVEGNSYCSGQTVAFEVWEDDFPTNELAETQPIAADFVGIAAAGTWIAEWQCDGELFGACTLGDPEYFFSATVGSSSMNSGTAAIEELHVSRITNGDDCGTVVTCRDYLTQGVCEDDDCDVAEDSVGNVNCDDPHISCGCSWNTTVNACNGSWSGTADNGNGGVDVGKCSYAEHTSDNCDDGFLTFSWTASWEWAVGNEITQYDPDGLRALCVDGSKTRECPAQIPLPFFGFYNFIIALAVIALIYILFIPRKR